MTIFLVLNGLGVVFLVYVLANFWKEGHRPRGDNRKYAAGSWREGWADVHALTQSTSSGSQFNLAVIPFRVPERTAGKLAYGAVANKASTLPVRRISTR
jgi:hypothetical protein